MKKIVAYEIFILFLFSSFLIIHNFIKVPSWYISGLLLAQCAYIGCIGGCLYCLRSVYLNKCVLKQWDESWHIWYYLRPITSTISGFVSYIFLKAGLLVLDASTQPEGGATYGYLAIAFIAGYNVDNFMKKLESIVETAWGISKSKATSIGQSSNQG